MEKIAFSLFSFLFFSFNLFSQISQSVNFSSENLNISEIIGADSSIYTKVIYGDLQHSQEIGYPELPVKFINLIIPTNQMVENISVSLSSVTRYDLEHMVYPVQADIPTSIHYMGLEFVEPAYKIEETYPTEMVKIVNDGYFDGNNHIVTLAISPVQYIPKLNQLIFYSDVNFTLQMESSTPPGITVINRKSSNQLLYDNILLNIVDNPEDVAAYQVRPMTVEIPITIENYEYVIITSNALKNSFNKFIEWKKRKGIDIGVVTTEDILSSYSGDLISGIYDDAGKIRQFLYESYIGGTVWALLAGDYTVVPLRYGCGYKNYWTYPSSDPYPDDYKIPADLYLADFNGDWDVDGDQYTGEIYSTSGDGDNPDYNPEIFVGRLLCSSSQDIANWTEKLILYEQNPGKGNTSYLTRAFMFESDHMQNGNEAEGVASVLPSFSTEIWRELPSYNSTNPTFPSGDEVINEMNTTRYGLWSWFGHGEVPRVNTKTSGNNLDERYQITSLDVYPTVVPNQTENGLNNLNNQDYPAIVYTISCDITPFDDYNPRGWWNDTDKNMGEGFTVVTNVGGPALLGNTRYGWVTTSSYLYRRFANQIESGVTNLGCAELILKMIHCVSLYPTRINWIVNRRVN